MHEEQHHAGARDGVGQGVEQGGGEEPCQAGQQGQVRGGLDVPSQVDAALPQRALKQLDLFNSKDSELIRTKEDDSKMEVSLDTPSTGPTSSRSPWTRGWCAWREGTRRRRRTGQDGEQELLKEVHPAQGRQARRCGLESLLRRRSRHHRSKKCPSNHKCEGGPEVRFRK